MGRILHTDKRADAAHSALRASFMGLAGNLFLVFFKLAAGFLSASSAMISDGVHSATDVCSAAIVLLGVRASTKEADTEHPYGHERFEALAALLIAVMLFITGLGIGYGGLRTILQRESLEAPGLLAAFAALVSVGVKLWMSLYTRRMATRLSSTALFASAGHYRMDAAASFGVLLGVLGARLGYPVLDPIAGILIALLIVKAAFDIFADAANKLVDCACDAQTEAAIRSRIEHHAGILGIGALQTRAFGARIYVDGQIRLCASMPLWEACKCAQSVEADVEAAFAEVKRCRLRLLPEEEGDQPPAPSSAG